MMYAIRAVGTIFYRLSRSGSLDPVGPLELELAHAHEGGALALRVLQRELAHARVRDTDWYKLARADAERLPELMREAYTLYVRGKRAQKMSEQRARRERRRVNTSGFEFDPSGR